LAFNAPLAINTFYAPRPDEMVQTAGLSMKEIDGAWLERAATAENQWVRAVILKKDHVAHGDARNIALNASEMAKNALGTSHTQYGIALLNLGLCFEVIEKKGEEATHQYLLARQTLGNDHPEYAEAMYWLGVYQFSEGNAKDRAVEVWSEALNILRQLPEKSERMADLLISLSCFYINGHPKKAAQQLQEALEIQRKKHGPRHAAVRDTETRFAAALRAAAAVK
jgi:tetratricopeptide (TPR) repeat protein